MVSLFGKKKKPEEEEIGIKEQVGYPPESGGYEEPPEGAEQLPPAEEPPYNYPPEGEPPEGAELPPDEDFPPFLPRPGERGELPPELPPEGENYTKEDLEKIARDVADEVRQEFEEKLKSLNKEVEDLRRLDSEIEKMYGTFEKLNKKYLELEDQISDLPTKTQEDLKEIKSTVNAMNQIMSSALPALIKEVRDLKPKK